MEPAPLALCISSRHLCAVGAHARRRYPDECCGLLLGELDREGARVAAVLPAANLDPAPRHGYFVAPRALLRGHRLGRERGLRVIGYYHSHPDSPALPSRRDDAEALPGDAYLIVAVQSGAVREVRCFRAAAGDGGAGMDELPVVVAAAPPARRGSGRASERSRGRVGGLRGGGE